jgi:hypothetical protein
MASSPDRNGQLRSVENERPLVEEQEGSRKEKEIAISQFLAVI